MNEIQTATGALVLQEEIQPQWRGLISNTEYVWGLRYKLRVIGIPVEGCAYVYGDGQSVLTSITTSYSQLKKKRNNVAYHHFQEGSVLDEWRTTYIDTHDNLSNILTNNLTNNLLTGEEKNKFYK